MCSKIVEFERYRAISRELLNAQTQDKYHHVAKSLKILQEVCREWRQLSVSNSDREHTWEGMVHWEAWVRQARV